MIHNTFRLTFFFMTSGALLACASAQDLRQSPCPPAESMKADQLHGRWDVRFAHPPAGLPGRAVLLLKRHAEFSESLAGTVSREWSKGPSAANHTAQAALAGDLDEGMLLLDESSDNVSITGTWNGEMKAGSCGKVYQGHWKDTSASAAPATPTVPFTMTRLP